MDVLNNSNDYMMTLIHTYYDEEHTTFS